MNFLPIVATFVTVIIIDLIWLGYVAKDFYTNQLSAFSRSLNIHAAFLSYLLIVLGVYFFSFPKAGGNLQAGLKWGFMFGIILYGVYDLVNLATLKGWTLKMTIVDMLWGGVICSVATVLMIYFSRFSA